MPKLTLEFVQKCFAEQGCKLLATDYANNSTKMLYICNCGKKSEITWNKFNSGQRCYDCRNKKVGDLKRFDLETVRKYYSLQNCVLLAQEYLTCDTKMPFICSCGRNGNTTYYNFKKFGVRCQYCTREKIAVNQRLNFEYVRDFFKKEGCQLLATEYLNAFTMMPYICVCGRYARIIWNSFQRGNKCKTCSIEKLSVKTRFSFEYVKNYFESNGCKLLATEYVNSYIKMPYVCVCGNISEINFNKFCRGGRCNKCKGNRLWDSRRQNKMAWEKSSFDANPYNLIKNRLILEIKHECG